MPRKVKGTASKSATVENMTTSKSTYSSSSLAPIITAVENCGHSRSKQHRGSSTASAPPAPVTPNSIKVILDTLAALKISLFTLAKAVTYVSAN